MLDLLVRDANLPDGRNEIDIAVKDGRIAELKPQIEAEARETIDANGRLVTPPFIDAHFHMDSTLSFGQPRHNESGTLLEGIKLWSELKPHLTVEAVKRRALALCRWAIARMSATTGCLRWRHCSK
jgi:cytosine deaminase